METQSEPPRQTPGKRPKKNKKQVKKKSVIDYGWTIKVTLSSIVISVVLSLLSGEVLDNLSLVIAFAVLLFFILINIIFDVIGMAVATADIKPFHSMAAQKLSVGVKAVQLIKNAEKVSNFCSDVIGDIAGVVSGSTGAAIIIRLCTTDNSIFWGNLIITALIAGLTICLKSIGKSLGMKYNYNIVYGTARLLTLFSAKKYKDKEKKNSGES